MTDMISLTAEKMKEVRAQVRVVLEVVESHNLEGRLTLLLLLVVYLLTMGVVEREKLKLTKLVYDIQQVLMDSDVSRELRIEVQDVIEACMGRETQATEGATCDFIKFED